MRGKNEMPGSCWRVSLLRIVIGLAACLLCSASLSAAERRVAVVNIGWHTGIAIAAGDIDAAVLPEVRDLSGAAWIEFGWGDAAFYRNPNPDIGTYLSAAFLDTPSVMHLVGMPVPPGQYFPKAEVVEVALDDDEFARLLAYLAASFRRDGGGEPARPTGPGLYVQSLFYDAVGSFSLDNTCNTWVARALAAAGLPIDPEGVQGSGAVMARLRSALEKRAR